MPTAPLIEAAMGSDADVIGPGLSPRAHCQDGLIDLVHEASEDSFPCSDPPSWTPVVGTGDPSR